MLGNTILAYHKFGGGFASLERGLFAIDFKVCRALHKCQEGSMATWFHQTLVIYGYSPSKIGNRTH